MRVAGWTLIVMAVVLHFSVCEWDLGGNSQSRVVPFLPFVHAREALATHYLQRDSRYGSTRTTYNTMAAGFWGLVIPLGLVGAGIGLILRPAKVKAILGQVLARAVEPRKSTEHVASPPVASVVSPPMTAAAEM